MEADDVTSTIVESSKIPEDDNTQEKLVPDPQPEDRQPESLEKIKEKSAFTLRYYQDLIAAQATKTNTIVYLPTGTGKTFIAFRVIEYRLQFIRIARDNPNEWPRVIIFIAPKRALLHQQIQSIRKFCAGAKAEEFGGGTLYNNKKIDEWGLDEWRYHLQRYEVLGMTPATLQVLLEKSLLPPHTIDLLVLDECHHATGNDPMAKVCDALKLSGMSPLILGLTASPIKSKHMRVRKAIERLEQRTMCTFFSPTEEYLQSVRLFAFKPPAVIVTYADVSLVAEEEPQKSITVDEDEMDLAPTIPFETPKKVGEVHHEFLSALEEMKHLYRRLHCADCIQQLHDSDLLLKRRAFTLVAQKLGIENPLLISFQGIRHIRECMRQLCEVTRSCGVYFGLQSIIFYLQKVISMMGKRRYRVLFQEDFEATLLASTSQSKECIVMSDSEGSKVPEEDAEDGKAKGKRVGEPKKTPEGEKNKNDEAILSQESRTNIPAASTAHGSESPQLWKTLKLSRRMRFAGPELTDELLGDDDDCFLFSDGTGDDSDEADARDIVDDDEEDDAADESTVKSDGTGVDSEGDPFLATFEDSHLIEEPSLAFKSDDFSPDYIAFLLDTGKGDSSAPVMDIDWSQVEIPEEVANDKTKTSPQEETKSKSNQFHKRRLKHQTYHTYDFDQMRRSTPMIFQLIDNDASYFQFMVNQFVCGIVTILQGFQHLMSLFTPSLLEKVIQEYSPVAVEVTNETKTKHPVRAAANLLVKYMRGSMEKKFFSWKEMMDDIRLLQQRSLAYEIVTVAKLISRCISLQPLEVPIKPCRKIDQRNYWESLVASIEATDAAEKEDEIVYLQRKEDAYFFPKIVRLFSVLRSIWHRGDVNDADTYTHYDFMTEKPFLNKIDGFEWIDRLKSALQSSTSRATATIEEDGSSQKVTPYSQMPSTIVFCNKKVMACGLTALLHDLWFDRNVTAGVLTGDIPIEQQRGVLESFRNERVQVLFATEVAEEGLDIKQCSSIVNFDPPATAKAFIQRRGRARGQNSLNINVWPSPGTNSLLFEALSRDLQGFLSTERRFDDQFVMYTQTLLSQQQEEAEKYTVESTGAYVDYVSAQALVYDYCQSLLHVAVESKGDGEDTDEAPKITVIEDSGSTLPFYTFESYEDPILEEKVYVTTLHLPPKVEAPPFAWTASKKQQGKGRAALDAVRFLHKKGVLDDHLRVVNHLRDISPFESLVADRRSKKHLKQFKDEDDAALDGDEDKVDLLVKVVADDLTKTPTITGEESMQVDDSETIHAEPPASISLHYYCVQVVSMGINRKPSQDANAKREIQKVTKEGLLALQGLAFAVPSIADAQMAECVFQSILRELKDERFTWTFRYLGEHSVSQEEVAMMQAFHRAVFAVGAPSFPSKFKDKYGYVDPVQALSILSAMTPEASNLRAEMFPFHDAATWTRSSNHAWYLVLPVKVTRAPWDPATLISSISFEDVYDASFVRDEAITAAAFVSNLKVIQDCNNSVETANPLATIDSIDEQPRTPQEYNEWVFTSTGRMMFRIDAETPCNLKVSDIADSKKKLTFLQLFQKRGPQTVAWIDEQMKKCSATLTLIVPGKDSSGAAPAETVAKKEIEWPDTLQMRLITLLSTKLTLWNFIGKQIGAHLHGDRAAPTNRGRQQYILPPLSQPIGRPRHYYQIMILPGLAYRWVSLCLARELRQTLQCRLVKKVADQSFVQRLLAQPEVSASKNEAMIIEEYTPKLIALLEAMTTSRAQEMFQSERLEFLGDSFLKLAASVEVYTTFPYAAEGELTMRRRHLICNRTLSQLATKDGLAEYLRVLPLSRGLEEVYFTAPGLFAMGTSDDDATGGGRWIAALRNANLQKGATASAIAAALARKNAAAAAAAAVTEEANKAVTDDVHVAQAYQPESIRDQRQFLRQLPGKVLADIMESLLGTCVLLNDEYLSASFAMVYALRMVPHNFAESWLLSTPAEREQRFHFPLHTSIAALMAPHPNHLASEILATPAADSTTDITTLASSSVVVSDSDTEAHPVTAIVEGEEKSDQAAEAKPIEGISKDSIAATALLQQQRRICLPLESATIAVIEKRLNYHFTCPNLLAVAFTHASMSYEYISYERLEFLGDAVLDFIVAKILYDLHPDWDEGHLSHSKHEHTNNKYLSAYGEQLDVLSLVRHNSSAIFRELHQRHQKAKESKRAAKAKVTKSKANATSMEAMDVDVDGVPLLDKPKSAEGATTAADGEAGVDSAAAAVSDSITKVQADVIEALVGAVYLDCGGNVAIVELMLRHLGMLGESLQIKPVFTSVPNGGPTTADPTAAAASTTSAKAKARSKAKNKAKTAIASAEDTTTAAATTTAPTVVDSTPRADALALKTPDNCASSGSAMDVDDKAETPGAMSVGSTASPGPAPTANSRRKRRASAASTSVVLGSTGQDADADDEAIGEDDDDDDLLSPLTRSKRRRTDSALLPAFPRLPK